MLNNDHVDNPTQLLHQHLKSNFECTKIVKPHDVIETVNFEPEEATYESTRVETMTPCTSSANTTLVVYYKEEAIHEHKKRKKIEAIVEAQRGALLAMCGMVLTALALILTVIIFGRIIKQYAIFSIFDLV